MHINVYFLERYLDEQQRSWINSMGQHRAITFGKRAGNQSITNKPAIHEQVLRITRSAPVAGRGNKTADARDLSRTTADRKQVIEKFRTKDLIGPFAQIACRRDAQNLTAIVSQRKRDLRVGQRVMSHQISQMKAFGSFGPEEFSPRRHIKEEITNGDGGAARVCRIFDIPHPSAFD